MQAENVGEHIQSDISAAMGFCSRESARKAIVSAIRHVVEARMNTQLPEEIAEIKESVNRIIASTQAIIFSIGDKTDDDIKKELMVQFRQLPLGLCDVVDRVNVMFCGINRQP